MAEAFKTIATWFSGTHEQLMELLKTKKHTTTNNDTNLNDYTVAELKNLAKERNLKGYSSLNKAALVQFIKNNS